MIVMTDESTTAVLAGREDDLEWRAVAAGSADNVYIGPEVYRSGSVVALIWHGSGCASPVRCSQLARRPDEGG